MTSTAPPASPPPPQRYRDFRLFVAARLGAGLGQTAMMIVIGWQTYSTARLTMNTHAAAGELGLIGLAQFVPVFLLSPITGWIADHYDRRRVATVAFTLQLMTAMVLGHATWAGTITLPLLYAMASILGTARAFSGPAVGAMAPRLVPRTSLPAAIAFISLVWQSTTVIGPALGGYLFSVLHWAPHLFATVGFLTAVLCISLIRPLPPMEIAMRGQPLRQILDGFRYVRDHRLVLGAITLDLMAVMLAGSTALLPVYARDIFHTGPQGMGQLAACMGIGAGLTALLFGIRPPKDNVGNKMLIAVAVFGAATAAFGLTAFLPAPVAMPVAMAALFVCGVADMFSVFVRQTLIQVYTPDEMRGRVSSFSLVAISASNELGEAESGFFAALIGPVTAVVAGGIGAVVTVLLWSRLFPEIGRARRFDAVLDVEHPSRKEQET